MKKRNAWIVSHPLTPDFRRVPCLAVGLRLIIPLMLLATACGTSAATGGAVNGSVPAGTLDRAAIVARHNVVLTAMDHHMPLQVGNGELAFGMDVTGLQTFTPFNTMAQWGWHESPLPAGMDPAAYVWPTWDHAGRRVPYMTPTPDQSALVDWLYVNPHRINLGRLGLSMTTKTGRAVTTNDLENIRQELELFSGTVRSHFEIEGVPVDVETAAHPTLDGVAVRIRSALVTEGRLAVFLDFPGADDRDIPAEYVGDWEGVDKHRTELLSSNEGTATFARTLDATTYRVGLSWGPTGTLVGPPPRSEGNAARHRFLVKPGKQSTLEVTLVFAPATLPARLPTTTETLDAAKAHWRAFWKSGAAVDLSGSTDPRWKELERRIVLSQYLMAVNEAGSLPPQESGLVANSGWSGKLHLEMYWWHGAHYGLWDRWPLFARSLGYLTDILPKAEAIATKQGYKGARWPKMVGPQGRESSNEINPLVIWQQPHPIFYAELDYRLHPTRDTLERWRPIVFATAEFMASFAVLDTQAGHYDLLPPIRTVPEITDPTKVKNPVFELTYWRMGLRLAQTWRERLGLGRTPEWDAVLRALASPTIRDGVYLAEENLETTYTQHNYNHPSLAGAFGVLPGDGLDPAVMTRTFDKILATWRWDRTWGWDFPMVAMCAARLDKPGVAVDMLLHPSKKGQFDKVGLSTGGPYPYFPSNGGLLYAVAMMAAGWDGAPARVNPGFPDDGSWVVRWEGLRPAL